MDHEAFDRLVRALGTLGSRRAALGALLGAGMAAPLGTAAASAKKRRNGKKGGKGAAQVSAQAADCLSPGPSSNMNGCPFQGSDFSGDDLSGSSMVGTNFNNSELVGAKLHSSNMRNASFRGADLTCADLSSSTLRNADFRGFAAPGRQTNLTRADLSSSGCGGLQTNGRTVLCGTTWCDGSVRNDDCPGGTDVCCPGSSCPGGVECIDGRCADCGRVQLIAGPPAQAVFTWQKPQGIVQLFATRSENADTVLPPFTPGTTGPIVVTSTKIFQDQPARVGFQITDGNGVVTVCRAEF